MLLFAISEMVKCSGFELMEGLKKRKKPLKKKKPKVQEEVDNLPTVQSKELETTEVPTVLTKVQGEVETTTMPAEVRNTAEAPTSQGSPSWAAEASQPAHDVPISGVD